MVNEVNKLKNENGKDIIVYGGSSFVSALVKDNLIDEFHLIGTGHRAVLKDFIDDHSDKEYIEIGEYLNE